MVFFRTDLGLFCLVFGVKNFEKLVCFLRLLKTFVTHCIVGCFGEKWGKFCKVDFTK